MDKGMDKQRRDFDGAGDAAYLTKDSRSQPKLTRQITRITLSA